MSILKYFNQLYKEVIERKEQRWELRQQQLVKWIQWFER